MYHTILCRSLVTGLGSDVICSPSSFAQVSGWVPMARFRFLLDTNSSLMFDMEEEVEEVEDVEDVEEVEDADEELSAVLVGVELEEASSV
jgi:hypothetical protein